MLQTQFRSSSSSLHSSMSFSGPLPGPRRLYLQFIAAPRSHLPHHLRHARHVFQCVLASLPTSLRDRAILVNFACAVGTRSQCLADLRVDFPRTLTSYHSRICACTFTNSTHVPTDVKSSPCTTTLSSITWWSNIVGAALPLLFPSDTKDCA